MATGIIKTEMENFWGKTQQAHIMGKAISGSSVDFILPIPYTDVPYDITFVSINISGISGNATLATIHVKNPASVYFRVSPPSSVSTNQAYVAGVIFTLTPSS